MLEGSIDDTGEELIEAGGFPPASPDANPDTSRPDASRDSPTDAPPRDSPDDASADCGRLHVDEAWVSRSTNCAGIQGSVVWYGEGANDLFRHVSVHSDPICFATETPAATEALFIGIYLNQAGSATNPIDYNATLNGVVGFRVTVGHSLLSGDITPFVGVQASNRIYCIRTPSPGTYDFDFTDLRAECWATNAGPSPDPEHILALVLYYPRQWPGEAVSVCAGDIVAKKR